MIELQDIDPEDVDDDVMRILACMEYFVVNGEKWTVVMDCYTDRGYFKRLDDD